MNKTTMGEFGVALAILFVAGLLCYAIVLDLGAMR